MLEEVIFHGKFVSDDGDYWVFEREYYNNDNEKIFKLWKIKKTNLRGIPELDFHGQLNFDDSYTPEEINGEWYLTGGLGRLMTFMPIPF